jgi:hypothetical protein
MPKSFVNSAVLALAVATVTTTQARGQDDGGGAPQDGSVDFHAFLSTSFHHNWNDPPSRRNALRVFDSREGEFLVDAELVAESPVEEQRSAGFRLDVALGSSIAAASASSGLFRDESGAAEDIDLQQAWVSFLAPIGNGLRLDLGKHVSHMGYEVIEGHDGVNDHATRSFLFGYAVPFTHTGLRATYSWSDAVSTALYVVNGWDNVRDNNDAKTLGLQGILNPDAAVTLIVNAISGAEQAGNEGNLRQVVDWCGIVRPSSKLTLGANLDYGMEEDVAVSDSSRVDVTWWGGALYGRAELGSRSFLSLRLESFDDGDGARTGTAQQLTSVTLTPEFRPASSLVLRSDLRLDRSDEEVFEDSDGGTRKDQFTCTLNCIYIF